MTMCGVTRTLPAWWVTATWPAPLRSRLDASVHCCRPTWFPSGWTWTTWPASWARPPQSGGAESTNPELKAQAARLAADARVLPDTPYDLAKLRTMDADVRLKAHRINAPGLPIEDMDAHLELEAGILELVPLNFGVAGGDIRSTIRMDARENGDTHAVRKSPRADSIYPGSFRTSS